MIYDRVLGRLSGASDRRAYGVVQFWDHVFLDGPPPSGGQIPAELLATCRREFDFWCAAAPPPPPSCMLPSGAGGVHQEFPVA